MDKDFFVKTRSSGSQIFVENKNRQYTFSSSPLLSSVVSLGKELLAAPMRVVCEENGALAEWTDVKNFEMDESEDGARIVQSMQGERFLLNTHVRIEDDGCMDWSLTIAPRGRSVNQVFGLEKIDNGDRILTRLWVEIPLKKSAAKFYQTVPYGDINRDGEDLSYLGGLSQAGKIGEKLLKSGFKQQFYVGNDESGLGVFFESDEGWNPRDRADVIECETESDTVVMRLRILDGEPTKWRDKGKSNGMDCFPISFRFGMMVTPVRVFPANPFIQRNLHIDCFKKIAPDYEEYLFSAVEGGDETMFDRIKRLGVDTLYIHEKWNDIQNSPDLTKKAADRLRLIVNAAHERGIKVAPYFGYEISTLSPVFAEKVDEYVSVCGERGHWYRKPWQRALTVCYKSGWQDYYVEKIRKIFENFGIDGLYLDCILSVSPCTNRAHGCGYVDENGKLKPTYPIWEIRKLFKRLRAIADEYGGFINGHSYGAFPLAAISYCDFLWEGESIQSVMLNGETKEVPEDFMRSVYTGRSLGVPVYMLCYSNPPVWTYRQATACALPFGIIPKPNDAMGPLEETSAIWRALDGFDFDNAEWKPYYTNGVESGAEGVKVSYFDAPSSALAFVANMLDKPAKAHIEMPFGFAEAENAANGEKIDSDGKTLSVSFDKSDYVILRIKKN